MRVRRYRAASAKTAEESAPPALPYPSGWFCVGFAAEWLPGSVLTKPFMGEDIVVYRTRRGALNAVRPFCPHLGAHLGVGGTIDGELLICPFHKFGFAPDGTCTRTPYGSPPKASLRLVPIREAAGIVWAWHAPGDARPNWELPASLPHHRPLVYRATDMVGHPQDVVENAVDYGHFLHVHGTSHTVLSEPKGDGPFLSMTYRLSRPMPPLGTITQDAPVTLIGMAGFHAEFRLPHDRLTAVTWVLCTPIAPWRIRFWAASSAVIGFPKSSAPLRNITARLLAFPVSHAMNQWLLHDTKADVPIYRHKRYVPHPKLNNGDGPIGPIRRWSRQFYPPEAGEHREDPVDERA